MTKRTFMFPWLCRKAGILFYADGWDIVEVCPMHEDMPPELDSDTGEYYPNHFEDGHLRRVMVEEMIKEHRSW